MTTTKQNERKLNPQYKLWCAQVNANYHDYNMTTEEAEKLAGPEPERWLEKEAVQ